MSLSVPSSGVLYHFSFYGYENTVIESQVVTPMRLIQARGFSVKLIFMEGFSDWLKIFFAPASHPKKKSLQGFDYLFLPRVPRNFLWLDSLLLGLALLPALFSKPRVLIHARGLQGTTVALLLRAIFSNVRVVSDVRGLESEEYDYAVRFKPAGPFRKMWKKHLASKEKEAVSKSDAVFCVSRALIHYFQEVTNDPKGARWEYVPCAVETERFKALALARGEKRKQLGLDDRFIVIYLGSLSAWQVPDVVVNVFKAIRELHPKAFFLGLSPETENFERLLSIHLKDGDYKVMQAPFGEIPELISCGDIGLLIREKSPVNRFSCPTKFAEYLACGLHVVATPSIEDVTKLLDKSAAGTVLAGFTTLSELKDSLLPALASVKGHGREASLQLARDVFDWNVYLPHMEKRYRELLGLPS